MSLCGSRSFELHLAACIVRPHYLQKVGVRHPDQAVVAVAGPIEHGSVHMTNLDWRISEDSLRRAGGFRNAKLINDFTAQALAAPLSVDGAVAAESLASAAGDGPMPPNLWRPPLGAGS